MPPAENGRLSLRYHRHSVVGVLTIQRPQCEFPANESRDGRHLTLRKAISEERPQMDRGESSASDMMTAERRENESERERERD